MRLFTTNVAAKLLHHYIHTSCTSYKPAFIHKQRKNRYKENKSLQRLNKRLNGEEECKKKYKHAVHSYPKIKKKTGHREPLDSSEKQPPLSMNKED